MPSSPKLLHASINLQPQIYGPDSLCSNRTVQVYLRVYRDFTAGLENKCKYGKPLSVSVAWDRSSTGTGTGTGRSDGSDEGLKHHKVMGFAGIQTGFGSVGRRRALRQKWFPSNHQGLQRPAEGAKRGRSPPPQTKKTSAPPRSMAD